MHGDGVTVNPEAPPHIGGPFNLSVLTNSTHQLKPPPLLFCFVLGLDRDKGVWLDDSGSPVPFEQCNVAHFGSLSNPRTILPRNAVKLGRCAVTDIHHGDRNTDQQAPATWSQCPFKVLKNLFFLFFFLINFFLFFIQMIRSAFEVTINQLPHYLTFTHRKV